MCCSNAINKRAKLHTSLRPLSAHASMSRPVAFRPSLGQNATFKVASSLLSESKLRGTIFVYWQMTSRPRIKTLLFNVVRHVYSQIQPQNQSHFAPSAVWNVTLGTFPRVNVFFKPIYCLVFPSPCVTSLQRPARTRWCLCDGWSQMG